jgi:hypothetical protein
LFDRTLRLFIVTPDMRRVHHSVLLSEHDRNYGFNLSLWDRLFGTYLAEPEAGQHGMTIGLPYDDRLALLSKRGADSICLESAVTVQTNATRLKEAHGEIAQKQSFVAA